MKLKSIKEINYNGCTYNLHVKDNHNYFANNINVSNCHRFASTETSAIVKETLSCKYKWGFTGTLPEDPSMKMELLGLFGIPKSYISSSGLIERGLATPININSIIFKYNNNDKNIFRACVGYQKQLKFIKEHEKRNKFIVNLTCNLKNNTLLLFSHTEHGKTIFYDLMKKLYPNVEVKNKNITGKKSFEFQKQYGVYFIAGSDDTKIRELTRRALDEDFIKIIMEDNREIFVHGDEWAKLSNGSLKLVKELDRNDDLDETYINNNVRDI
jgi:hypothetical protein